MNLLLIKQMKDGTTSREFLAYDSFNAALSALYYALWIAASDTNINMVVAELINDDGRVEKCERYFAPVSVEESEVNE